MRLSTLNNSKQFQHIKNHGSKIVAASFMMVFVDNSYDNKYQQSGNSEARFGFIITKKNGNAVVRNRIKRKFRAAIYELYKNKIPKNYDFLLIARHTAFKREYGLIVKDFNYAFSCIRK